MLSLNYTHFGTAPAFYDVEYTIKAQLPVQLFIVLYKSPNLT